MKSSNFSIYCLEFSGYNIYPSFPKWKPSNSLYSVLLAEMPRKILNVSGDCKHTVSTVDFNVWG